MTRWCNEEVEKTEIRGVRFSEEGKVWRLGNFLYTGDLVSNGASGENLNVMIKTLC